MKYLFTFLMAFIFANVSAQLPEGFVYVDSIIPDLDVELRYHTDNNFVGTSIKGYHSNRLVLTLDAAKALKAVHEAIVVAVP